MRRRAILLATLPLANCVRFAEGPGTPPPETVGEWRRILVESIRPTQEHAALGASQAFRYTYRSGGASILVEAVFFRSGASAFEARQRHSAPATVAFHRGPVFVVCSSDQPVQSLLAFSHALEQAWLPTVR